MYTYMLHVHAHVDTNGMNLVMYRHPNVICGRARDVIFQTAHVYGYANCASVHIHVRTCMHVDMHVYVLSTRIDLYA